jgi:hypothetical protein
MTGPAVAWPHYYEWPDMIFATGVVTADPSAFLRDCIEPYGVSLLGYTARQPGELGGPIACHFQWNDLRNYFWLSPGLARLLPTNESIRRFVKDDLIMELVTRPRDRNLPSPVIST